MGVINLRHCQIAARGLLSRSSFLPDGRFSLEAEIEDTKGGRYSFSVTFEEIDVE